MTKLTGTLPKGESYGLEAVARRLIDDPHEVQVLVLLVDCKKITTDLDTGDVEPTARIRRIEAIEDPDKDQTAKLLRRRCEQPSRARGWCKSHWKRWKRYGDPLGGGQRSTPGDPQLFIELASRYRGDRCLEWPYGRLSNGYGHVVLNGEDMTAHRAVLLIAVGEPAPDMVAAHLPAICHNRLCVNPAHLRWATQAENVADMTEDGTAHWLRT